MSFGSLQTGWDLPLVAFHNRGGNPLDRKSRRGALVRFVPIASDTRVHPLIPEVTAPWQVGGVAS
jgi:hypothetical protein